jgi:hypothetical protein
MRMNYQFLAKAVLGVAFLLFPLNTSLKADTTYNDGGVHGINSTISTGVVSIDNKTTVNVMTNGVITGAVQDNAEGIDLMNNSSVNIYDGSVTAGTGSRAVGIYSQEASSISIYGGTIAGGSGTATYGIDASNSNLNINGGNIKGGSGDYSMGIVTGNSTTNIHGGNITGGSGKWSDGIETYNSTMNIYGGNITGGSGGQWDYGAQISIGSVVNIYGGSISGGSIGIVADRSSVVNWYGGNISAGTEKWATGIVAFDDSRMNIFGSDFNYGFGPVNDRSGILIGTLSDGTAINIRFRQDYAGQIILSGIPEPATLTLLGLGGLAVLKRRKR